VIATTPHRGARSADVVGAERAASAMSSMFAADSGRAMMKIYHGSSFALAGLVPAAAMLPGGSLPIDVALGVALPVHSHIALNFVRCRVCERARVMGENILRIAFALCCVLARD